MVAFITNIEKKRIAGAKTAVAQYLQTLVGGVDNRDVLESLLAINKPVRVAAEHLPTRHQQQAVLKLLDIDLSIPIPKGGPLKSLYYQKLVIDGVCDLAGQLFLVMD